MIPLRDDNPTVLSPFFTLIFIAANIAVFVYELSLTPAALSHLIGRMGLIPASFAIGPPETYLTVFTSMFLHGGWLHLLGNMLYLWIFGNNIEDSLGHLRFMVFYLIAGAAAAATQVASNPALMVPTIGASGAVSGILGAYLFLFPRSRILTLVPLGFFVHLIYLPAWVLLLFWVAIQAIQQALQPLDPAGGGVAYAAHIGGFVGGLVLVPFFRKYRRRRFR